MGARSRSAIRSGRAARGWWARWSARWLIATPSTGWRPCASASARASHRSGRGFSVPPRKFLASSRPWRPGLQVGTVAISEPDPQAVRSMFDRIARRYDLVNTVLSAGTDTGWRRRAARETAIVAGGSALDVACGSGKLTAELARIVGPDGRVVGLDFSPRMLDVARHDHPGLEFIEGDALKL